MSSDSSPEAWPTEIKLAPDKAELSVTFENGESYRLAAEMLRVMSPSAEVQGHTPEERKTVAGKRNVRIRDVRPVGNYAVQIVFDDGHDTGFYRWGYLRDLGARKDALWQGYLTELKAKGLTRG